MENENARWAWAALRHVDQDNVAILQRRDHAIALNGHDAQQGGGGLQALPDPGAAEVEIPPHPIFIFNDCAAAHRGAGMGVLDRDEVVVVVFRDGVVAIHPPLAGAQPLKIDFYHGRDACELFEVGDLRFATQDVINCLTSAPLGHIC